MSGVSYSNITMDQNEYNRLINEANRANSLESALRNAEREMENLRRSYENQIADLTLQYTVETQNLRTEIRDIEENFDKQIKNMEKAFKDRLKKQEQNFSQKLKEQETRLRSEIYWAEQRINNRIDREVKEINNRFKIVDKQIRQINNEIEKMKLEERKREEYARNLLNDLKNIINNIDKNLPHEKYFPSELEDLKNNLILVENNIKAGMYQAAISTAQSIYMDTLKLRKNIIQEHEKYLTAYQVVMQELTDLKGEITKSEFIEVEGTKINTNFWSDNKLEQLKKKVDEIVNDLKKNKDKYKVEDLKRISEGIEKLREETPKIIEESVINAQLSHMRAEVADFYRETLEEQGFIAVKMGYANDNPKNEYLLYMKNLNDEEIIVKIYLDKNKEIKTEMNSFFKYNTIEFATEREKEILDSLNETGIVQAKQIKVSPEHNYQMKEEIKEKLKL